MFLLLFFSLHFFFFSLCYRWFSVVLSLPLIKSYHVWCGCFSYLMLLINFTFLHLFFLLHHTIPLFFAWLIIGFYYLWYHSLPLILYMVLALVFGYSILSFLLLVDFLLNLYLLVIGACFAGVCYWFLFNFISVRMYNHSSLLCVLILVSCCSILSSISRKGCWFHYWR